MRRLFLFGALVLVAATGWLATWWPLALWLFLVIVPLLALGCIQARRCNSNLCPVGVATQNRHLVMGLDVNDKMQRVAHYHHETIFSVAELLGAMGLDHARNLQPWHILRRTSPNAVKNYTEIFKAYDIGPGDLLVEPIPEVYRAAMEKSTAHDFRSADPQADSSTPAALR